MAVWMAVAIALAFGRNVLLASLANLLLCRIFFVDLRWRSATRGFGAPGFMTYWTGAAVCLITWLDAARPAWSPLAVLTFQIDYALIMLSAGIYKFRAGYRSGDGMQFGLANPQWGYWSAWYAKWPPQHWAFRVQNQLAWSVEVVGAVLMLIPQTRLLGALAIALSFVYVATQIRLATLCWVVILGALLFVAAGSPVNNWLPSWSLEPGQMPSAILGIAGSLLPVALGVYLALLPLAHLGLWTNLYARRRLPEPLQRALELYTNLFGLIVWRVFSADHTNFFVRVLLERDDTRRELTRWGWPPWGRFNFVGESIALTSLFTLRRYYPQDEQRFHDRLRRIARTLPYRGGERAVFRVVLLESASDRFREVDAVEYVVEPDSGVIEVRQLDATRPIEGVTSHSPIHTAARPGTYAPAR
jgi:hypothetical protein